MRQPSIHSVTTIHMLNCSTEIRPGVWVPSRPLGPGYWWARWRAAWLVFTGRADAVTWHGQ